MMLQPVLKEVGNSKFKQNQANEPKQKTINPQTVTFHSTWKSTIKPMIIFALRDLCKWIFCRIKFILGFVYLS